MFAKPSILLRIEGGAIFAASVFGNYQNHASWMCFILLFLTPDLFMLSYLANMRVGLVAFVLIWTAHIGFDRLLGFGLKYPTRFKDTHLQHV